MAISSRTFKSPGFIIAALSVLSLGIVGFGLFLMLRSGPSTAPAEEPATEDIAEKRKITALGRIEPAGGIYNVAAPSAISSSRVQQILVQEGAQVKKGDLLAVMDSYERLRASVIQAEAQVLEARSNLAQVEAGEKKGDIQADLANARAEEINVQVQQVNVGQQEANINERTALVAAKEAARDRVSAELKEAQRDLNQTKDLFDEGALAEDIVKQRAFELSAKVAELEQANAEIAQAQQQLEQAKFQLQQALGEVVRRQQQLAQATGQLESSQQVRPEDIQRAKTGVQSALANMALAQAELDQAGVAAPIDGQVLEIHTSSGEAVGEQGILDLARTNQMTVVAEIYETDIRDVQVGQPVKVTSPALATSLQGRVAQVGLKIDKKDVLDTDPAADTDARVVEVTVLLENSEPVANLTNLQVNVSIDTAAPILRSGPGPNGSTEGDPLGQPGLSNGGLLNNGLLGSPLLNESGDAASDDNSSETSDGSES